LNSFDIIVFALVVLLGIKGILRGFVSEITGFVAILGGIFVASRFGKVASAFIASTFSVNHTASIILSFIVVFGAFWLLMVVAGGVIKKFLESLGLASFDRVLGFVVGGGKVFLILSIVVFAFSSISLLKPKMISMSEGSFLYPHMVSTGAYLINLTPEDLSAKSILSSEANETNQTQRNSH
jgi:membrane protein required for colicin V production